MPAAFLAYVAVTPGSPSIWVALAFLAAVDWSSSQASIAVDW